jgi:hypothetical protein
LPAARGEGAAVVVVDNAVGIDDGVVVEGEGPAGHVEGAVGVGLVSELGVALGREGAAGNVKVAEAGVAEAGVRGGAA